MDDTTTSVPVTALSNVIEQIKTDADDLDETRVVLLADELLELLDNDIDHVVVEQIRAALEEINDIASDHGSAEIAALVEEATELLDDDVTV
jgi:hypothetical protein